MATTPTSVRLTAELDRRVAERARRSGSGKTAVIAMAVDEWIRVQDHPRIAFVTALTGERRARLVDGPEVWTIAEAWRDHEPGDRNPVVVAEALGLTPGQVSHAIAYWADFRDEVDALIATNLAVADEAFAAWERRQALA